MYLGNVAVVHGVYILPHRRSERVMCAAPPTMGQVILFRVVPSEQGKFRYPEEVGISGH